MQNLLTARGALDGSLAKKVSIDEEGILQVEDEVLAQTVETLLEAVNPTDLLQAALSEEQEQVFVDALASLAPEIEDDDEVVLEPVHPGDLLTLLLAFVADAAGSPSATASTEPKAAAASVGEHEDEEKEEEEQGGKSVATIKPKKSGGGFSAIIGAFRNAKGLVLGAVRSIRSKIKDTRRSVWRIDEAASKASTFALRLAKMSARPILIFFIVKRALATIERSRLPLNRISRLPAHEQTDAYYTHLLGSDWKEQFEQDWIDAAKEAGEGLITDDYLEEKRKLTAVMLRRLEVEDWDKERMRHFYYGSYGMGPWYLDMEERLHNPFFTTSRAWNGPIEGWVGKNRVYKDSVAESKVDIGSSALKTIEAKKGVRLTDEQRRRVLSKQLPDIGDALAEEGSLFSELVGGSTSDRAIEATARKFRGGRP